MEKKEFENFIYVIINENDYTKAVNLFYSKMKKENDNLTIFFKFINELKKGIKNKQEKKYISTLLVILECIARENNLIAKYESYDKYQEKMEEIKKIIKENWNCTNVFFEKIKDELSYKELNMVAGYLKKKLILENLELSILEKADIRETIKICARKCKEIKEKKILIKTYNTNNELLENSFYKDSEDKIKEIEKNSLLIIDYDNIKPDKDEMEILAKECTLILICHRVSQEILIKNLRIKGFFKVINVNSEVKQASDFKIYSLLTKAQLIGINNVYLLSKDKGFDIYCGINQIKCKRLESIDGYKIKETFLTNFTEIDNITLEKNF